MEKGVDEVGKWLKTIDNQCVRIDKICRIFVNSSQNIICTLEGGDVVTVFYCPLFAHRNKYINYERYVDECLSRIFNAIVEGQSNIVDTKSIVSSVVVDDYYERCN